MTHPVNNFMVRRSSNAPAPRALLHSPGGISLRNPAVLGPDRGAFASNPGRGDHRDERDPAGRCRATFTRLCDRKKFGMVGVRTVTLSQFRPQTRHRDCSAKLGVETPEIKGKAVRRGR